MSSPTKSRSNHFIVKRLLIGMAAFLSILVILVVSFIFFLPNMISADWFREVVENQASKTLHRPVHIKRLSWRWDDEIRIEKIRIEDLPEFSDSPLLSISQASIKIDLRQILERRLMLDFILNDLSIQLIRDHSGQTNLEKLLRPLVRKEPHRTKKPPTVLKKTFGKRPIDLQGSVQLKNMSLLIDDRITGRRVSLENAILQLQAPSLYRSSLSLKLISDLDLTGHPIHAVDLKMRIDDLFDDRGAPDLARALIDVDGAFPGAQFHFSHNPAKNEIKSHVRFHLSELSNILFPFFPASFPSTEIAGDLDVMLNAFGNPSETLSFETRLAGDGIRLSGKRLANAPFGPFDFILLNKGRIEAKKGVFSIEKGELQFLENGQIHWRGKVTGFNKKTPEVDITIGPVWIDLKNLFALARPLIAKTFPLDFNIDEIRPILKMRDLRFSGPIPSGPGRIEINDMAVTLPETIRYHPNGSTRPLLSLQNLKFSVHHLASITENMFPKTIDLTASAFMDKLRINGGKKVYIERLEIPGVTIGVDEIQPSDTSPFGLSLRFNLLESIILKKLNIPELVFIDTARQTLNAAGILNTKAGVELWLKNVKITIPSFILHDKKQTPFQNPSEISAAASRIAIDPEDLLKTRISDLNVQLMLDKMMKMNLKADIKEIASMSMNARGKLAVDLRKIFQKFLAEKYTGSHLAGNVEMGWRFAGRFPTSKEIEKIKIISKLDIKKDLSFLDQFDFSCGMKNVDVNWAVTPDERIKVGSVSTPRPLTYRFDKQTGSGKITGDFLIGKIDEIPLIPLRRHFKPEPLTVRFSFSGEHQYLSRVSFSQTMDLKPFDVKETLRFSLYGLDRIAKKGFAAFSPGWLQQAGGIARGTLTISNVKILNAFIKDLNANGKMEAGAEIRLTPGQRIGAKGWVRTPQMNIALGNRFSIEGLQTDVRMEKNYRIINRTEKNDTASLRLSVDVLQKKLASPDDESKNGTLQSLMTQMRKRFIPKHSLSFRSARLGILPRPLKILRSTVEVDLSGRLPNIDYFQTELLGGTVIGFASIAQKKTGFFLRSRMSFSGLDARKLFPGAPLPGANEETSVSGEIFISLPLTVEFQPLLRDLRFNLKFNHIGPHSLGWFLYMMDPYENNETIVSQRRMLRIGMPRWIELTIKNGILSLYGEVIVKGIALKIPPLERLNIGNLPEIAKIEERLAFLDSMVKGLHMYTLDTLHIAPKGGRFTLEMQKR